MRIKLSSGALNRLEEYKRRYPHLYIYDDTGLCVREWHASESKRGKCVVCGGSGRHEAEETGVYWGDCTGCGGSGEDT